MIVISVAGFEQVSIFINQRLGHLQTSSLMSAVGGLVEEQTKRRIASEKTSPDGAAWAPLKPATVAKKGSANILVDTGRLLGSISHISGATFAVVGTNVYYAKFHQSGTRKMMARAFVGLSTDNRSELERVIHGFIARQIG
jgi:phage virion morphogenesis protein